MYMATVEERNYSFNFLSLLIKVVIFAILLVLLIWFVSKFAGGSKKCKTLENDYYIVSSFTEERYKTKGDNETYDYSYNVKLLDISESNSKNVSVKSSNYFHDDSEYEKYLKNNDKFSIINQTNGSLVVDNSRSLMNSSLTAAEFSFELSEMYVFEGEYYIDVNLSIGDHSKINAYSNSYFVPIHLVVGYTESGDCK